MYGAYDTRKDEYMRPGALGTSDDEDDERGAYRNEGDHDDMFDYTGARDDMAEATDSGSDA